MDLNTNGGFADLPPKSTVHDYLELRNRAYCEWKDEGSSRSGSMHMPKSYWVALLQAHRIQCSHTFTTRAESDIPTNARWTEKAKHKRIRQYAVTDAAVQTVRS